MPAAVFLNSRVVIKIEQVSDIALYNKVQELISLTEFDEEGVMLEFQIDESPKYFQLWQQGNINTPI